MKFSSVLSIIGSAVSALSSSKNAIESGGALAAPAGHRIPTTYESAVMARRILALTKLATFCTVFPSSSSSSRRASFRDAGVENDVAGLPIGLVDYIADCEDVGNPTILELEIGTTFKNVRGGSNITVSLQWVPPYPPAKRIGIFRRASSSLMALLGLGSDDNGGNMLRNAEDPSIPDTVPYSADNLPRFALFGYLESFGADEKKAAELKQCYTAKHPDSKYWLPGNNIHTSFWTRMVVTKVYWIGGFGDRAYIGWIPIDEWKSVTEDEWKAIKLPGEIKGWSEWNVYDKNKEL